MCIWWEERFENEGREDVGEEDYGFREEGTDEVKSRSENYYVEDVVD